MAKRTPPKINEQSKAFGRGVKASLAALKKSQYWLEAQTGIGVTSINKIILGKANPLLSTAVRISEALKIDVYKLIDMGKSE